MSTVPVRLAPFFLAAVTHGTKQATAATNCSGFSVIIRVAITGSEPRASEGGTDQRGVVIGRRVDTARQTRRAGQLLRISIH